MKRVCLLAFGGGGLYEDACDVRVDPAYAPEADPR
jgi:hypothetical protein